MSRLPLALMAFLPTIGLADPPTRPRGEFLQMLDAVLSGSQMGPGDGWFKDSHVRYSWARFQKQFDRDKNGRVSADEFGGPAMAFKALDRDGDGFITADDFDWSDGSTYSKQMAIAGSLVRRGDQNADRKLNKAEWTGLFDRATGCKDTMEPDDLRQLLFPPPPKSPPPGGGGPSTATLLIGLMTGELGSGAEGPKHESAAPDFTLTSFDGKRTYTLSDCRDKKPVVLIFGSFT